MSLQPAGSTLDSLARQVLAGFPNHYQPQSPASASLAQVGWAMPTSTGRELAIGTGIGPAEVGTIQVPTATGHVPAVVGTAHPTSISHPVPGFSGARVWRVETAAGPCALRASPAGTVDIARLNGLHRLLKHIYSYGVTEVSVPIAACNGATSIASAGFIWQLEPWMPGAADFWSAPTGVRLQNAMTALARWHLAAARFHCLPGEGPWFSCRDSATSPGLSERLQQVLDWDGGACDEIARLMAADGWTEFRQLGCHILQAFRRVAAAISAELCLAARVEVPLQPCLRDIWHDHVLFTAGAVTGLIDPHACRSDCVATDLARLLGSLVADDRDRWRTALECYEKTRPLNFAERGLIDVFDRSAVALNGLIWLTWRYCDKRTFTQPERVLQRLEAILRRLEALSETFPASRVP